MYDSFGEINRAIKHEKEANCCTVVATAIACNVRFSKAKRVLASVSGRRKGRGVPFTLTHDKAFKALGKKLKPCITWTACPTVTSLEKWANRPENSDKVFLVYVRGHVLTIRKGKVIDWTQGRRHKVQAVYEVLPLTEEI